MKSKTKGYAFTVAAIVIFACQDGFSKFLGGHYPPVMVTMVRFWAFAVFVTLLAAVSPGGLRGAIATRHPFLQLFRGIILVSQITLIIFSFNAAGLAMTQSVSQATPLLVTILSVPLLGETVGWRRGLAIVVGLCGVLVIINPVDVQFGPALLLPLAGTLMFSLYSIATRAVSKGDSAMTSVFYSGLIGALVLSLIGPFYWTPFRGADWLPMAALCITGALSHYCLIRAYSILQAVEIQPITYFQLVLSVTIAVVFFGEQISWNLIVGALIVVSAGLYTVWREFSLGRSRAVLTENP